MAGTGILSHRDYLREDAALTNELDGGGSGSKARETTVNPFHMTPEWTTKGVREVMPRQFADADCRGFRAQGWAK